MRDSCEHVQCQRTANMAAWIADGQVADAAFIDLARVEPGLRPFSVDCAMSDAVLYLHGVGGPGGRFWMLRLSEVTDPDLIARLEEAAVADEPVTPGGCRGPATSSV